MNHAPALFSSALALAASLAALAWPIAARAQACNLIALQKSPCELVSPEVVAQSLGVPAARLKVEDNLAAMGRMPDLTVCIYVLPEGGQVRVGQIAKSSPAAFDSRYRSQSESEIAAGMGAGTARAEQAVGRSLGQGEKAQAQAGAAEIVRGMQYQPVSGLGERATVMYSGSRATAYLTTLVKDQSFVVEVGARGKTREQNLAHAKPIAAAVAARCR
jgi:hypothetical protein